MQKIFKFSLVLLLTLIMTYPGFAVKQYGIALHGDLKLKAYESMPYVNPKAPKGGDIRLAVIGTFDSLNPFITKGTPPAGISLFSERLVFESLMKRSSDEPFSLYGLIAESCDMAKDRSYITFYLNPKARWSDGKPITANDVLFTFETLRDKGRINMRSGYKKIERVVKVDDQTITFFFNKEASKDTYESELPLIIAMMPILPQHFFLNRDFEKVTNEIIPFSGPYKIKDLKMGRYILYERRLDYWGQDLAIQAGLYNFDTVRFDFYREQNTLWEAFKAGAFDVIHVKPAEWFHGFNFPAAQAGKVIKQELSIAHSVGVEGMVFNIRRPLFKDKRVRQAFNHAFDFHWVNRTFYYNTLKRTRSYFQNTDLENRDEPQGLELEILNRYKSQISGDVFLTSTQPPESIKPQDVRRHMAFAQRLLNEAGWTIDNKGDLRNEQGQLFEFEMLIYDNSHQKIAMAFARSLKTLGIIMNIRLVDTAQYQNRYTNFDFDMTVQHWGISDSPGNEQLYYWGSESADKPGSRNIIGIKNPIVDELCKALARSENRPILVATGRALDRVLLSGYYMIPLFHKEKDFIAYWDKFGFPPYNPKVGIVLAAWWSSMAQSH